MLELDPFEALALTLHHSPGAQALLLGSGLSRAAGIPTGWEITLDLIRELAKLRGAEGHPDWSAWYRDEFDKEPSYSEILDGLGSTPSERRSILHRYIEAAEGDETREPTNAHRAIARLVATGAIRVIVTTNFDRLLENALREAGIEPTVIASEDALKGATPLVHSTCTVIKLHGDYLDARILNTQDELESYSPAIDALLDRVFDEYGLIVAGWSGEWDTALRQALLRAPTRRYPFYWATRGPISELGREIVRARAGRIIEIEDADKFFVKLADTVAALAAARRPHPESLGVTLALAKKYVRDDKFALEWSELLRDELAKIRLFVIGSDWPTDHPNKENINALVAEIVGRTEALRRICLIGERWGTRGAQLAIERALAALNFREQPMGGFAWWIELRNLPASLCFQWALSGALYNDDYSAAARLMNIPVRTSSSDEPKVAAAKYPMNLLDSSLEWKILDGLEKRKLPHSAFLENLFEREASDIVLDESEIIPLFDETEVLIAMQYAHLRSSEEHGWFWTPLGQFIFRDRGRFGEKLGAFEDLEDGAAILKAGLLGGTSASAKSAVQAFREFIDKHAGSLRF
jgi:hypothetical protein